MIHQSLELAAPLDAGAAASVTAALRALDGIGSVSAAEGTNRVAVTFDGERTSLQELATVLARAGHALRAPQKAHGNGSCCGGCGG